MYFPSSEWLLRRHPCIEGTYQALLVEKFMGNNVPRQATWILHCLSGLAGSHPTDVRMTTRFKDNDLTEGLTGAIHETGHALYEQGRNLDYDGLPVNQVSSSIPKL